ncbi:MAG: hypothetical protein IJC55_00880 [Clostridia bacterium]|nr:hypothetical protein [Clostridia bacterium]
MTRSKKKFYTKLALTLSAVVMAVWGILGTSASLAWFSATDETQRNIFQTAEFEVEVSYRKGNDWKSLDGATEVFDRNARYEPGYLQVVYLRIQNAGSVAFDYNMAVTVLHSKPGKNASENEFYLQEHLTFGMVTADDLTTLQTILSSRSAAAAKATMPLQTFATETPVALEKGQTDYAALIIYMPKSVDNIANYREQRPEIELGITVNASQQGSSAQN